MSTQTARRAALTASAIVVAVATACAGNDPMTIEEYAAWCGDFEPFTSVEGQAENWREAEQVLSDGLDHAERLACGYPFSIFQRGRDGFARDGSIRREVRA